MSADTSLSPNAELSPELSDSLARFSQMSTVRLGRLYTASLGTADHATFRALIDGGYLERFEDRISLSAMGVSVATRTEIASSRQTD